MEYKIKSETRGSLNSISDYELLFSYGLAHTHNRLEHDGPVAFAWEQAEAVCQALEEVTNQLFSSEGSLKRSHFSFSPIEREDGIIMNVPLTDPITLKDWHIIIISQGNKLSLVVSDKELGDDSNLDDAVGIYSAETILNHSRALEMTVSESNHVLSWEFIVTIQKLIWKYY